MKKLLFSLAIITILSWVSDNNQTVATDIIPDPWSPANIQVVKNNSLVQEENKVESDILPDPWSQKNYIQHI